jgi:ACS family D-galactonate transporter-like MFS transporter
VSIPNTETTAASAEDTPAANPSSEPRKDGVQRRTAVRWKLFLLLLVLVAVNYIDRGSISVALPIIQKEFNLAPELVGLLLSAFFWTYALMQIPVGLLIDKFGPRKVMTASCIGWGAATAASGMSGGFLSMFIARMGIGVTEAGVMPAGGKLNAIWMHKSERGRGATILDAGAPLGAGLGGILITRPDRLNGKLALVVCHRRCRDSTDGPGRLVVRPGQSPRTPGRQRRRGLLHRSFTRG